MKLFNNFTGGAMNKDLEIRVFPKSFYLDAKNVRISTAGEQNSRSVKLPLGNSVLSSVSFEGTGATCVGSCVDNFRNLIYWAVATSTHSYILEYNVATDTVRTIVDDINSGGVFLFTTGMYVEMRVINDNDNGRNFLVLTDDTNEPKFFEIDTVQAIGADVYTLEDVSLIKAPPSAAPALTLGATVSGQENNLESKFLSFAYRYKYQNGEYSALSPFSEFAFLPDNFSYNYREGTNNAMFNNFSKVDINLVAGTSNVQEIQLIVKESGSNTAYIVDTYDNTTQTVTFDNSRIYKALDNNQLSRIYDNVPITAATLEVIGNRIVFGNYADGYNLTYEGSAINTQFDLTYVSSTGTTGNVHKQVKTNRDYEIAIAYEDGKGRLTTPLVSDGNTTFIPYSVANQKNQLVLTINRNQRPPDWATGYRLYLKQSKIDYDVIAPVIFYRDGIYGWLRLEGNDINKVNAGDFIYVKSDTSGLKSTTVRAKVLEVTEQGENFLENQAPDPYAVLQEAGIYMRLQVDSFALSEEAVLTYEYTSYSFRRDGNQNNISDTSVAYTEDIFFDGGGKQDLTVGLVNSSYTSEQDRRFEVEITGSGNPNTFRWREYNVTTATQGSWSSDINITGNPQTIGSVPSSQQIDIDFNGTTGYTVGDRWFISVKAANRVDDWNGGGSAGSITRSAIIAMEGKDPSDEEIKAGANITITYDDTSSSSGVSTKIGFKSINLTSSKDYPNLEEWYYGDNIFDEPSFQEIVKNQDAENVMFRRGFTSSNLEQFTVNPQKTVNGWTYPMTLLFLSPAGYTGNDRVRVDGSLTITEFENALLFETIPTDTTTDVFYELPYRYGISGGNHLGDTNQVFGVTNAVVTLDYFNSFGWYNGFESYKIGDTFNEKAMILDTKPSVPIDNYQQIKRIAGLTYGGVYEATTQFNSLNEFNLATVNYKDLDIQYGAIRKLHSRDTDLVVFQHDKTQRVLYNKSVLFNADGTGNVSQSSNVLGQEVAFTGEYGICNNPESFAFFGNRIYHLDKDRGALMRLSVDGYTEISKQGMSDYFRTLGDQTSFVGGYDPYNDEYLINLAPDSSPLTLGFKEGVGFTSFYQYQPERLVGLNNRMYGIKDGQIWLHDSNTTRNNFFGDQRTPSVTTVFNDAPQDVKHFKSINLESSNEWAVTATTNFGAGTIATTEFVEEEQEYYAYFRQNETSGIDSQSFGGSIGGIGVIDSIDTLTLTMDVPELPRAMSIGDVVWKDDEDDTVTVSGTITSIDRDNNTITLDSVAGLTAGNFIMFEKNERVEGSALKGYYMQVVLTNASTDDQELFAVKLEAARSSD